MPKVILFRLLQFPLILAVIYLITFLLAWVAPGDPFQNERGMDPIVKRTLERQFHAESGWQFLRFHSWNVLRHGDLGPSMKYQEWTVNHIIADALPVSVTLGLFAMCIAVPVGVAVGTLAAVRRGGALDWTSLTIALVGISVPSFVVASALLMFAAATKWLPVGGWGTFGHLILPGFALSLWPMAYIVRLTRVSMLDTLGADFVRTARAKGLARGVVIWKHCLRNSFLPVLSYLGPATASTLVGSFVVEKVFNIPGLGQHFVNSVLNRDRTLILGVVMVESALILLFNLLVDIAYAWVDPRIEVGAKAA
ncbi:MAG TPA: ABC transporter permease [Tepidisphaeraceae bacterium]|jgi:oligopeptide transport system permease protein